VIVVAVVAHPEPPGLDEVEAALGLLLYCAGNDRNLMQMRSRRQESAAARGVAVDGGGSRKNYSGHE